MKYTYTENLDSKTLTTKKATLPHMKRYIDPEFLQKGEFQFTEKLLFSLSDEPNFYFIFSLHNCDDTGSQ